MSEGSHLTVEGINLIREIKLGMNKGRKWEVSSRGSTSSNPN